MSVTTSKIVRRCIIALIFAGGAWWFASTYYLKNWSWPVSFLFGAVAMLVFFYLSRLATGKPAPFQLVLRLADDKGGDCEDDMTFERIHARFKQHFSRASIIRFDGFDTDGSFIWFYFLGPDEASVRHAVLPQLEGCRIRQGSYFVSNATQPCAAPNDGPAMLLGDLRVTEGPSSVS